MMFGFVNNNCEAIIKVAVGRIGSPKIALDAVIDTGIHQLFVFAAFCHHRSWIALALPRYCHIR